MQAWRDEVLQLVVSLEILAEYQDVALRLRQRHENIDILQFIDLVAARAYLIHANSLPEPVCEDPNDDMFLARALAARTRIIISGDRHLLAASGFRGVNVLRPRTFVDAYL